MNDAIKRASEVAAEGAPLVEHGGALVYMGDKFQYAPPLSAIAYAYNSLNDGFLAAMAELEAARDVCAMRKVTDFYISEAEASCQRHELSIGGLRHYTAPTAVELRAKLEAEDGR